MQSWGTASRFEIRDTQLEPSKSGVVGLVAAALGVARDDRGGIARLAAMPMAVRVDRQGVVRTDFQTAGGGAWPGRKRYGVYKAEGGASSDATLSRRHYLAGASFLVGLGGDGALAEEIDGALRDPRFPLWLGRKGYALSRLIAEGIAEGAPEAALRSAPRFDGADPDGWLVVECAAGEGDARSDVPILFTPDSRVFGVRHTRRVPLGPREADGHVAEPAHA